MAGTGKTGDIDRSPCARDGFVAVDLAGTEQLSRHLSPLFSGGVGVDVVAGCTVRALLTDQLTIGDDYVEGRLQTIFLNGKPVDDIDTARVGDGDVLALSAAMPGLVGATMRRGGRYAVLRRDISHDAAADCPLDASAICLNVKLFNLIAAEVAPHLFRRGVWIAGDRLAHHARLMAGALQSSLSEVTLDGAPAAAADWPAAIDGAWVHLTVRANV